MTPNNLVRLPSEAEAPGISEIPSEFLAPMGCGIQTGAGAILNSLPPINGGNVVVVGCGAVGLSAVLAGRNLTPAGGILAIDINPHRLELAEEFGASVTIQLDGSESQAEITEVRHETEMPRN